MPALRPLHYQEIEKFLRAVGCHFVRQKGSHRVFWRADQIRPVILPVYKNVPVFIIRNILRQLKVSPDEFLSLL